MKGRNGMKVRLSKAKKPPVLSQIRFRATSKNLAGFAQKKVADDDKRFLQKKVIPVKLFYVIDEWFEFVSRHGAIFRQDGRFLYIKEIAMNIETFGLPSAEFENGLLFLLEYIQKKFLEKISSEQQNVSSTIIENTIECIKALSASVLECCFEFSSAINIHKKYSVFFRAGCTHLDVHNVQSWKSMLFPIFLSYGAFKTVCNRISKAGPYTVSLVYLMDLILLDSSSQSECCNRCVEACVKKLSESILLSIINFPWVGDAAPRTWYSIDELRRVSNRSLSKTNDVNAMNLCIDNLKEKQRNRRIEVHLSQYAICKRRNLIQVFSKALDLPCDVCFYILSTFVGYNLSGSGRVLQFTETSNAKGVGRFKRNSRNRKKK
eukprot:g15208.t1